MEPDSRDEATAVILRRWLTVWQGRAFQADEDRDLLRKESPLDAAFLFRADAYSQCARELELALEGRVPPPREFELHDQRVKAIRSKHDAEMAKAGPMTVGELIDRVIDLGIVGARESYGPDTDMFRGSRDGFEACRGLGSSIELKELLREAGDRTAKPHAEKAADHWYWSCREDQIRWTCNCVSVVLPARDKIVPPTARATLHVDRILKRKV